jgi:hypothetical protein
MTGADYLPLLQLICGQGVELEVGDPSRPSPEVVKGMLWAVCCNNGLALVIVFQDETVARAAVTAPLPAPGQVLPVNAPPEYDTFREFYFKWVRIVNVLTVKSDVNVRIDIKKRALLRTKPDPLYTDGIPEWSKLNNALVDRIQAQLKSIGVSYIDAPKNIQRTDANDPMPVAVAAPLAAEQAVAAPAPVVDVVAVPVTTT